MENILNILTGFICGIIQSKQVKLANVVSDIPYAGKEESTNKIIRIATKINLQEMTGLACRTHIDIIDFYRKSDLFYYK